MTPYKTAFVGIVGPTNSGKSTLLNAIIGEKVSIVSPRAQTTYHGVRGILQGPDYQIVFTDTPGFQKHTEKVARLLNKVADRHATECELLIWVFDASNAGLRGHLQALAEKIKKLAPAEKSIVVLNKVDKVAKPLLLPLMDALVHSGLFSQVVPISARTGDGVDVVVKLILDSAVEGKPLYPQDAITDRPQQFLVSEFIREKVYRATGQEIPYSVWVEIEEWNEEGRMPNIRAIVHVDSSSRKAILIGKGGLMLKEIGSQARIEIEKMLGRQVCLKLHVDVQEEWKNDPRVLNRYLELV